MAAANGYLEVIDFLAEHKADLNARDNEGWTPIHAAVYWDQVINKYIQSKRLQSALFFEVESSHSEVGETRR